MYIEKNADASSGVQIVSLLWLQLTSMPKHLLGGYQAHVWHGVGAVRLSRLCVELECWRGLGRIELACNYPSLLSNFAGL